MEMRKMRTDSKVFFIIKSHQFWCPRKSHNDVRLTLQAEITSFGCYSTNEFYFIIIRAGRKVFFIFIGTRSSLILLINTDQIYYERSMCDL
jgi:hypothetical protein